MAVAEIERTALQLPLEDRLHLARRLVESINAESASAHDEDAFRREWTRLSLAALNGAYGPDEPEYTQADVRRT